MLNNLKRKTTKDSKRNGRGYGSKKGGHTSGRGMKGQRSRSGYKIPRPGFEGGQMPLSRRLPKLKGFTRAFFSSKLKNYTFNVSDLNSFKAGETIDPQKMVESGMIDTMSKSFTIKILGDGEVEKKLNIVNIQVSQSAKEKIEAKGGSVK